MQKLNKKAFTLVEVVIAMAIIGIIASLTIPTYFANSTSRKNQYVASLKKAYSELSYATDQIKAKNGGTMYGISGTNYNHNGVRDLYCNYLKCTKKCDVGAGADICFSADYKNLDGDTYVSDFNDYSSAILNNGMSVIFYAGNPLWTGGSGSISIDINGFKPPNRVGRDIFAFRNYYHPTNKFTPYVPGTAGWDNYCEVGETYHPEYSGQDCSGRVLQEGKMLY